MPQPVTTPIIQVSPRIGSTLDQCVAKYGAYYEGSTPPSIPFDPERLYAFREGDYLIKVVIYKGMVIELEYSNAGRNLAMKKSKT